MKQAKNRQQTQTTWPWPLIAVIAAVTLLAALVFALRDSVAVVVNPTPTQIEPARLPAEAIEQAGFVEVRPMTDVKTVYLFTKPNASAEKVTELQPGARGELLGQDTSGEWLYVRFADKTGWMPIYFLIVTAVE